MINRSRWGSGILILLILCLLAACGRMESVPEEISTSIPPVTEEPTTQEETTTESTTVLQDVYVGEILITPDAEEADISYVDVKWLGIDMNQVLDSLPNLKKIYMIGCGLNNVEYAALQDAHPNVKIVWEVNLTYWTLRTDAVGFSTFLGVNPPYWLTNEDAYYLRYCTDLVALDIGHNKVSDLSFLQYLPNLKVLILADNLKPDPNNAYVGHLSDFSWLKYCTKLRYLEIFVSDAKDLSFLQYCPEIEDLNICYTYVDSIEYLKNLPNLQRLWMEGTYVTYEDFLTLTEIYPNATLVYWGSGSVDQGWREGDHYWAMRNMVTNNVIDPVYAD